MERRDELPELSAISNGSMGDLAFPTRAGNTLNELHQITVSEVIVQSCVVKWYALNPRHSYRQVRQHKGENATNFKANIRREVEGVTDGVVTALKLLRGFGDFQRFSETFRGFQRFLEKDSYSK